MRRVHLVVSAGVLLLLLAAGAWLLREGGGGADADAHENAVAAAPSVLGRASSAAHAEAPDTAAARRAELAAEAVHASGVQPLVASEKPAKGQVVPAGAGVVFGSCLRADGTPKPKQAIRLAWLDAKGQPLKTAARSVKTDADGRYELRDMRPGRWRSVTEPPVEFTLAPGERRQLDFRDEPSAMVCGRVLLGNGAPARDAWVFAHWTAPGGRNRETVPLRADAEGFYVWDRNKPGHLELVAASPLDGMSPAAVLELQPGEQRVVDLVLGSVRVSGRVLRTRGDMPVAGATVRLLPLLEGDVAGIFGRLTLGGATREFGVARTDGDGRFVLEHLVPGSFSVSVEATGLHGGPFLPLSVGTAGVSDLVLRVAASGSVSGTVWNESGEPWMNTDWVTAQGPDGRSAGQIIDGRFTLGDLAPGAWRITLQLINRPAIEQRVTVISAQWVAAELIVPAPSVPP